MSDNIKIITSHWDKIDPLRIEDYVEVGGYEALKKFLDYMTPKEAVAEIKTAKLAGRGGAGFPTGEKLEMVASKRGRRYFICNLDESEPGTYKDRMIVDKSPHLLLEGVVISSLAIGAEEAYIYINGNYKKQLEILETAIASAKQYNFLGQHILHSEHNLEIKLFSGAGAYICGEETALINSIEGNRGEPKVRPPYPPQQGLFGKPTVINNAETISSIPWIILNGGKKYSQIGSSCSPGTKLYILSGSIENGGIFEAPTGLSIKDLIYNIGGGMQKGKDFWFAQIGGACGRLALEGELKTNLDFSRNCECPLGSGSILVVDKSVNIHDLLVSWAGFFARESCGKCVPCREGTFRLYEIMKRLRDGEISDRDKIAAKDILWTLENTTFCPFGKFAATAIRDSSEKLKVF